MLQPPCFVAGIRQALTAFFVKINGRGMRFEHKAFKCVVCTEVHGFSLGKIADDTELLKTAGPFERRIKTPLRKFGFCG